MKQKKCDNCSFRKKYDSNPESLLGRLWLWHTKFCPGWKSYLRSHSPEEREKLFERYGARKI